MERKNLFVNSLNKELIKLANEEQKEKNQNYIHNTLIT